MFGRPHFGQALYRDVSRQMEYINPGMIKHSHKNSSIMMLPFVIFFGRPTWAQLEQINLIFSPPFNQAVAGKDAGTRHQVWEKAKDENE